jgi:hypothetical protein
MSAEPGQGATPIENGIKAVRLARELSDGKGWSDIVRDRIAELHDRASHFERQRDLYDRHSRRRAELDRQARDCRAYADGLSEALDVHQADQHWNARREPGHAGG